MSTPVAGTAAGWAPLASSRARATINAVLRMAQGKETSVTSVQIRRTRAPAFIGGEWFAGDGRHVRRS